MSGNIEESGNRTMSHRLTSSPAWRPRPLLRALRREILVLLIHDDTSSFMASSSPGVGRIAGRRARDFGD